MSMTAERALCKAFDEVEAVFAWLCEMPPVAAAVVAAIGLALLAHGATL